MLTPLSVSPSACTTVFYDQSCPLCRREVAHYQALAARSPIAWCDVSAAHTSGPVGVSRPQLMRRFHVQTASGQLLSGAAAFVHLWAQLPHWRYAARLARWPGALWLLERGYRFFLLLRPALQAALRRLEPPVQNPAAPPMPLATNLLTQHTRLTQPKPPNQAGARP